MDIEKLLKADYSSVMTAPSLVDTSQNALSSGLYQNDTQDAIDQNWNIEDNMAFDWRRGYRDAAGPGENRKTGWDNPFMETANLAGNVMGGFIDTALFGLPYLFAEMERSANIARGLDPNRWGVGRLAAEIITLGAYDHWEEETNAGMWSRRVGGAVGIMVPFGLASKGVTWAAKGMTSRSLTNSTKLWDTVASESMRGFTRKYAQKEGAEQIIAAVGKQGGARVGDVVQVTDNAFKKGYNVLLKDAWKIANSKSYKNIAKHSQVHMQKLSDDFAENLLNIGIATNKKQANLVSNKFISEAMYQSQNSMHTFTTHFARSLLGSMDKAAFKTGGKFSKLLLGPDSEIYTSQILGAMFSDLILGTTYNLALGTLQTISGKLGDLTGQFDNSLEGINPESQAAQTLNGDFGEMITNSFKHGMWMSLIGPTRFIKGGATYGGQGFKRQVKSGVTSIIKGLQPISKMSPDAIRRHLRLMNDATGNTLHRYVPKIKGRKFKSIPDNELGPIMSQTRKEFRKHWTKFMFSETTKDLSSSAYRMTAGMLAMNAPGLYQQFMENPAEFHKAFGRDGKDIVSNIIIGMIFSKQGRSFHTYSKARAANYLETGQLRPWMSSNINEINQIRVGLELLGTDTRFMSFNNGSDVYNSVRKHARNQPFYKEVDNLVRDFYVDRVDHVDSGLLNPRTAYIRFLTQDLKYNTNSTEYAVAMKRYDTFEQITNAYDQVAPDINMMFKKTRPKEIFELVESVNSISDVKNAFSVRNLIDNSTIEAQHNANTTYKELRLNAIAEMYEAFGFDMADRVRNGVITVPELTNLDAVFQGPNIRDVVSIPAGLDAVKVLKDLTAQGTADGWIISMGKKEVPINPKAVTEFVKAVGRSTESILTHVNGADNVSKGYFKGGGDGLLKLTDESMRMASRKIDQHVQIRNALTVLSPTSTPKGEMFSSIKESDFNRIREMLKGLDIDKNPVLDQVGKEGKDVEDVVKFWSNVKDIYRSLNPLGENRQKDIAIEDVAGLKMQMEKSLGDIFSGSVSGENSLAILREHTFDFLRQSLQAREGISKPVMMSLQHMMNGTRSLEKSGNLNESLGDFVIRGPRGLAMPASESLFSRLRALVPDKYNSIILEKGIQDWYTDFQGILETTGSLVRFTNNPKELKRILDTMGPDKIVELLDQSRKLSEEKSIENLVKMTIPAEMTGIKINEVIENIKQAKGEDVNFKIADSEKQEQAFFGDLHNLYKQTRSFTELVQYALNTNDYQMLVNMNMKQNRLGKIISELDRFASIDPREANQITAEYKMELGQQVKNLENFLDKDFGQINSENYTKYVNEQMEQFQYSLDKKTDVMMIKITPAQFESRYGLDVKGVENIIQHNIREYKLNKSDRSFLHQAQSDLVQKVKENLKTLNKESKYRDSDIEIDALQQVLTQINTKEVPKLTYVDGHWQLGKTYMVDQTDHGVLALGDFLNISKKMYVLDKTFQFREQGRLKKFRSLTEDQKHQFRSNIESDLMEINDPQAVVDNIKGVINKAKASILQPERYSHISFDEGVDIVIPKNTAKRAILEGFSESGAVYNELLKLYRPNDPVFVDLIAKYNNPGNLSSDVIESGILLARLVKDHPLAIVKNSGSIDKMELPEIKDVWKRLKMGEFTKGSRLDTKTMRFMHEYYTNKSSTVPHFAEVAKAYNRYYDPATKTYKKLKFLSVNDEIDNGYFSTYKKLESYLKLNEGIIKRENRQQILSRHKREGTKSSLDAATYLNRHAFLIKLSSLGIRKEWILTDNASNIIGFKTGAIKPKGVHVELSNDGKAMVWYDKTAFFYDQGIEMLLDRHQVDGLSFKSGNKINLHRANRDAKVTENFITSDMGNDILKGSDLDNLGVVLNNKSLDNVIELPWKTFNITNVAREHGAKAGANTSVYMHNTKGMQEWTGLDRRIQSFREFLERSRENSFAMTATARSLLGKDVLYGNKTEDTGDLSLNRVPIEQIVNENGLILDSWMGDIVADKLFTYFFEGGKVGTSDVPNSSISPMAPALHHNIENFDAGIRFNTKHKVKRGAGEKDVSIGRQQVIGHLTPDSYLMDKQFSIKGRGDIDQSTGEKYTPGESNFFVKRIAFEYKGESETADFMIIPWGSKGNEWKIIGMGYELLPDRMNDVNVFNVDKQGIETVDSWKSDSYKPLYDKIVSEATDMYAKVKLQTDNATRTNRQVAEFLSREGTGFELGVLESRQPRNQVNDVIINKVPVVNNRSIDNRFKGNSSEQNFMDVHNQDADFDYDKTSSFMSAPSDFIYEIGKKSGFQLANDSYKFADRFLAELDTRLTDNNSMKRHLSVVENSALLRGRFVKMHNIVTYFMNAFKTNRTLATYNELGADKLEVRLKPDADLFLVADNIGNWAKIFIDSYKHPPDIWNIEPLIKDILFGKQSKANDRQTRDYEGMFELFNTKNFVSIPFIDGSNQHLRQHLYNAFVKPVSKYLRYNRGMTNDQQGASQSLRLKDIAAGFQSFEYELANPYFYQRKKWIMGEKRDVFDISPGAEALGAYIIGGKFDAKTTNASTNPFDIAMRSLTKIYDTSLESKTKTPGFIEDLIMKAEAGVLLQRFGLGHRDFTGQKLTHELWNWVKNDFDYMEASKLTYRINSLHKQKQFLERNKYSDRNEISELESKMVKLRELKSDLELRIGGQYDYNNGEKIITKVGKMQQIAGEWVRTSYKPGEYVATSDLVFWNTKGDFVGVVQRGTRNSFEIKPSYRAIVNGRRAMLVSPEQQQNLYAKATAFGSMAVENIGTNDLNFLSSKVYNDAVLPIYDQFRQQIKVLPHTRLNQQQFVTYRKAIINKHLSDPALDTPIKRKAFLWTILKPQRIENAIAYHTDAEGNRINHVALKDNINAKAAWQVLLDIKNKSFTSTIEPAEAHNLLMEAIQRQTLAKLGLNNIHLDVKLDHDMGDFGARRNRERYAELNREYINKGIEKNPESGELALQIVNEWMYGERLISPQDMKLLERAFDLTDGLLFVPKAMENSIHRYPARKLGTSREKDVVDWVRELNNKQKKIRENPDCK